MQQFFATTESTLLIMLSLTLSAVIGFVLAWWISARKAVLAGNSLHELELALAAAKTQVLSLEKQLFDAQRRISELQAVENKHLQLQVRYEELEQRQVAEKELLRETRQVLFKDFELAAQKLFENSQEKLSSAGKQNLETVIKPFKEQLNAFNKRVEDIYHKENSQRNQLVGQIAELQKQTQLVSTEANNLASALKGENKAQGDWGEIILERLLEQSGLVKGREYETQASFKNEAGKNFRPDVVIRLPDEKDIVIDSKVSLVSFEHWSNADDREERESALKAHVESIRTHIRGLSAKNYEHLEGIRGLDFVFLFMPIEAAYVIAIQQAPELFKEAYEKNVVLVSPSSLMVALRTVETIWRYDKQNKNAEKIALSAGRLYDQFVLFVESLDEIGKHIERAGLAYDKGRERLATGRGNLVKRATDLKALGAKTSKHLTVDNTESEDDELLEESLSLEKSDDT